MRALSIYAQSMLSNAQHEKFALGIAQGMEIGLAYEAAGYRATGNAAQVNGCRLLKREDIQARVAELQQRQVEITQAKDALDRQWVIERLMRNAKIAMGEERVKTTTKEGAAVDVYMRDAAAANQALSLLGKELGMFIDRSENVNVIRDISDEPVTAEEWANRHVTAH